MVRLSDIRRAGVDKFILYRTREFDNMSEQNPKHDTIPLVERVLSWEKVFGPHIADLETRAMVRIFRIYSSLRFICDKPGSLAVGWGGSHYVS